MSVWVVHQLLAPAEEETVEQRDHLLLPFEGVPDLSFIGSQAELVSALSTLHPDLPPETLGRRAERYWSFIQSLLPEDLVVVPLHARREIALANVTGRYRYASGEAGEDRHSVSVSWYPVRIPLVKLGKHKPLFENFKERMFEVTDPDARNALRRFLPTSYNRFAGWKWLLGLLFLIQIISMLMQQ